MRETTMCTFDVAVCGSMTHRDQWIRVVSDLEGAGLKVSTPQFDEGIGWQSMSEQEVVAQKKYYIDRHFSNIKKSTVILVCNYEKNDETGYIGINTLMEMTAAYIYGKPIYVMNKVPVDISTKSLEINALGIQVIDNDITKLIDALKQGEDDVLKTQERPQVGSVEAMK